MGGSDKVSGSSGHDVLDGGVGNDSMNGGAGDDTLTGSIGQDTMTGGVGFDTFAFGNASESSVSLPDLISDFDASDVIRLDAIDADSATGGDQAFAYIAGNAFSSAAGELQFVGGLLSGDTNGDQIADFAIAVALNGVATIDAGQLIL